MSHLHTLLGMTNAQDTDTDDRVTDIRIDGTGLVVLAFLREADWEITGHQRIQKLVFLLDEHLGDAADLYSYTKYDHGPYASSLKTDLSVLDSNGLIRVITKPTFGGRTRHVYRLTEDGDAVLAAAIEQIDDVSDLMDDVQSVYDEYGAVPLSNVINDIHDSHPEYWENSVYLP